MPRNIPKGFDPIAKRWRKMYRGERYEIYCSQMSLPEDQWTEAGSYQARNLWWAALKAEIDTKPAALRPDVQEAVDELRRKRDLLLAHNLDASEYDEAIREAITASTKPIIDPKTKFDSLEDEVDAVCASPQPDGDGVNLLDPRTTARAALLMQHGVDLSGVDPMVLEIALGSKAYWEEKKATATKVSDDRRIGTLLDRWFQLKRKKLKVTTLTRVQGHKKAFELITHNQTVVLSADMAVDVLTEEKIEDVFHAIDAEERDAATKDKKWVTFKSFLKYVVKKRLVPQPLNLDDKLLTFSVTTKEKAKPVMADVRDFIAKLPDRLKLYALLAANCGMNNVDIGKLELRQIDLTAKTLTRRRLKTEAWDGVPTVTYRLWDQTLALLRTFLAKEGKLAILDAKGQPLYIETKDGPDEKATLYDKIKTAWRDHFGRGEAKRYTVKDFRYISADLIKDSPQYRVYRSVWLGHSPKTVAEKNYSSSEDCTLVCEWLHTQYFPKG